METELDPQLRERVDRSRSQIAKLQVLNIDYYPRQSHVVTFRDPWSFPILYHPSCNNLIRHHLADLAEKVRQVMSF
jgi:syntaxin-binding protein 1